MIAERRWTVNPISVYSVTGCLIPPSEYEACLKGATVQVKISISHQYLHSNKTDNYFADIQEVYILKRPLKIVASPGKRHLRDNMKEANKRAKK